ncbi:sensor histidine kinase [Parabacteroides acidifaciens]|uniref:histidine kinase n=2 Tax=Parabacteroides acidifaciens TaxID=2290935 RepID=A0A3D8HGX6_9BACT|nr:sensor histidine kinase [Parabacteroides acidifaciens]
MNVLRRCIFSGLLFVYATGMIWCQERGNAVNSFPPDSIRLQYLKDCCERADDTPEELLYLDSLLNESEGPENRNFKAYAYRNQIRHYYNAVDWEQAEKVSVPAISFFRREQMLDYLFETQAMIITLYTDRGEFELALQKGREMYKEAKAIGSAGDIAEACYVIAYACYISGRCNDALEWAERGVRLLDGMKDKHMNRMEFYFILAESSRQLNREERVIVYVDSVRRELIDFHLLNPDKPKDYFSYYWIWVYCNEADYELYCNHPAEACSCLKKADKYKQSDIYDTYKDGLYFTWSDYYLAVGDYDQATACLDTAAYYLQLRHPGENPDVYRRRAVIAAKKGDYKQATEELRHCVQIADSLSCARFDCQSHQLRSFFHINQLETERKKQSLVIHFQLILAFSLALALLLLCYLCYRFYRIKCLLAVAVEEAVEADENTSVFLSNMTRVVNDFLQETSAFSESLIRETEMEKRQEYAVSLCSRNELAQRVIFDILDVSKIESDRMQFHYEDVNLARLVREVYMKMQSFATEEVHLRLLPVKEMRMTTDPIRLAQVLENILHCAFLHAKSGEVSFGYQAEGEEVVFFVSCKGIVFSEEACQFMFDRLAQTASKLENIQLGMVISRGLIMKMGGRMSMPVRTESGCRIEFVMPLKHI